MASSDDEITLARLLTERLLASRDELVSEWVTWMRSRLSSPAVEALSTRGLRDHVPPVIDHLAHYVTNPTYALRDEMLAHLRLHGQERRDQGFDIRDVMAELDGLSHIVMRRMQSEAVGSGVAYDADALLTVFARLAAGLRMMAFVTVTVYKHTARDRRQELAQHMAEFGRTIGHELRSPLHAILLSIQVLEQPELAADEERRRQQLEVIRTAVKHVEGLMFDIDVLSMSEHAQGASHMSPLPTVIEHVRDELAPRARVHGVEIDFDTDVPRVAVETVVAQLALTNLVSNAIKYADPAKAERRVTVRTQRSGEDRTFVLLEVIDNGLGIPDDLQARVFERHYRAHPGVSEGAGLGLAITRKLVTERGGTIEVDSKVGQGTTMRVRVRALEVDSAQASSAREGPDGLIYASVRELLDPGD